jgi:hypothetical protein
MSVSDIDTDCQDPLHSGVVVPDLANRLRTEADAYLYLEELRWATARSAPKAGQYRVQDNPRPEPSTIVGPAATAELFRRLAFGQRVLVCRQNGRSIRSNSHPEAPASLARIFAASSGGIFGHGSMYRTRPTGRGARRPGARRLRNLPGPRPAMSYAPMHQSFQVNRPESAWTLTRSEPSTSQRHAQHVSRLHRLWFVANLGSSLRNAFHVPNSPSRSRRTRLTTPTSQPPRGLSRFDLASFAFAGGPFGGATRWLGISPCRCLRLCRRASVR